MSLEVIAIETVHAEVLEALQGQFYDVAWSAKTFSDLISTPGTFGFLVLEQEIPAGFVLLRVAAGEAEILIIGVDPQHRRKGMAGRLLETGAREARSQEAETLFLEVAEDNPTAVAFYQQAGFVEAGRRRNYYKRPNGERVDAHLFKMTL